jgi:hypothetical protein
MQDLKAEDVVAFLEALKPQQIQPDIIIQKHRVLHFHSRI